MLAVEALPASAESISYNFSQFNTGTQTWSNPTNILVSDNSRAALVEVGGGSTYSLIGYGFGFALPTSTVIGIEVEVKYRQAALGSVLAVRLLKDRSAGSSSDYSIARNTVPSPSSVNNDSIVIAGSPTDNWTGWAVAATDILYTDVNSANFGIAISGYSNFTGYLPQIDYIKVRIQYAITVTSPTSTGTGATSGGTIPWVNPGNVTASDNTYATQVVSLTASDNAYLDCTNFGFAIPTDSSIDSIKVEIEKKSSDVFLNDDTVQLLKAGARVGTNNFKNGSQWPTGDTYVAYNNGLWGTTWTPAEVNDTSFGVSIRAKGYVFSGSTASIDHVRITITYSTAPTPAVGLTLVGYGSV